MNLKQKIQDDMKAAMRAKETLRLETIRMLLAAIKQKEIDGRIELDDGMVLAIIEKLLKQRRDSIEQFQKAGRDDLVARESDELALLKAYLPEQLSAAEVEQAVAAALDRHGATSLREMGKVMAVLKSELAGRVDMAMVSALLKARLAA